MYYWFPDTWENICQKIYEHVTSQVKLVKSEHEFTAANQPSTVYGGQSTISGKNTTYGPFRLSYTSLS